MNVRSVSFLLALLLLAAPAWAADPWCETGGRSGLRLEWLPLDEADPHLGSLSVRDAADGRIVQVLEGLENYSGSLDAVEIADMDNDGCPDLAVLAQVAAIGNRSRAFFLYDRSRRRFAWSGELSGIGGLEVDPTDRNCLIAQWKGGAATIHTARYCWEGGRLALRHEYSVSPMVDEAGEMACYQHVESFHEAGGTRTETSCTAEF